VSAKCDAGGPDEPRRCGVQGVKPDRAARAGSLSPRHDPRPSRRGRRRLAVAVTLASALAFLAASTAVAPSHTAWAQATQRKRATRSDPPRRSRATHTPARAGQTRATSDKTARPDPCRQWTEPAEAWNVVFRDATRVQRRVEGRVLVRAQDGGLLLLGRDGHLWTVTPDRLLSQQETGRPFSPFSKQELGQVLQKELQTRLPGVPVQVLQTRNYVVCTTASLPYARWTGALFERLYDAFRRFWRAARLKLCEPQFPLSAVVLANRQQFVQLAGNELGTDLTAVTGLYSITANRMVLYDLTADQGGRRARSSAELIRRLAKQPENVATVVHEATHQIAFNSGFHKRYADNPLWLVEGVASFFETPDLTSSSGWRTVGKPNLARLRAFRRYLASGRPADSLRTLVATDQRLLEPQTGVAAYAEAWALTYFLVQRRRKQFVQYVELVRAKPLLRPDSPDQRLRDFEKCFGSDWSQLDRELVAFVRSLR